MIYSLILVNKPVIDSDRNEKMGRIKRYVVDPDEKRILAFILAPAPGQTSLEIIPYSSVKSVYNNAVIVENLPRPIKMSDAPEIMAVFMKDMTLIGTQVLTDTGMLAGAVRDFAFREKDGVLVRLTLVPEKQDGVARISAKHILKIVKARVMISALALKEPLEEEEDEQATEYSPEEVAGPKAPPPAAVEKPPAGKVPAPKPETPEKPKAAAPPPGAVAAQEMMELLRQLFHELSALMTARLDSLDMKPALEELRKEIVETLKSGEETQAGKEEEKEDLSALEILVEEKIKRGAGRHLEEIKETLSGVAGNVTKLASGAEEKAPDPALAEIRSSLETLAAKVGELESRLDPAGPAEKIIESLKGEISALGGRLPDMAEMRKNVLEHVGRQEELAAGIQAALETAAGRLSEKVAAGAEGNLKEETVRTLLDELREKIAGEIPAEDFRDSVEKMSAELSGWKKGIEEELERARERWSGEAKGLLESRLAESADRGARLEERVAEIAKKLEKRIIELREHNNSTLEKMDGHRETILDEIRSFTETVLKPEDLVIVQEWLAESKKGEGDIERLTGEINNAVEAFRTGLAESGKEMGAMKDAVSGLRESLAGKLDMITESVSGRVEESLSGLESLKAISTEAAQMVKNETKASLAEARDELLRDLDGRLSGMLAEQAAKLKDLEDNVERTVLKPADLAAVRQWLEDLKKESRTVDSVAEDIAETVDGMRTGMLDHGEALKKLNGAMTAFGDAVAGKMDELSGRLSAELDAKLDWRLADQAGRMEKHQEEFEETVRQLRDGLKENIETRIRDFAKVGDLETLRERVEGKVGDITDQFVERIERHLDERDVEMEQGMQNILRRIEKALQKGGGRPDLGNIFGGGLLEGIFGGGERTESQVKIPSRTSRGAARSAPAAAGNIEDAQIRRLAYLIGKKLRQDIADAEGNVLAGEGDVVDEEMIRLMRDKHCTLPLIRSVDFS